MSSLVGPSICLRRVLPELIAWAPPGSKLWFFGGEDLFAQIRKLVPEAEKERIPLMMLNGDFSLKPLAKVISPSANQNNFWKWRRY
jgi:hypothetical protein